MADSKQDGSKDKKGTETPVEEIDPFKLDDNQIQHQPQSQPQPTEATVAAVVGSTSSSTRSISDKPLEDDNQGFNPNQQDYSKPSPQQSTQVGSGSGNGNGSESQSQSQSQQVQGGARPHYSQHNELPPLPLPNVDLSDIQIVDAIKTSDGPGSSSYIAYIVQSGSHRASHRYSTFASLRSALVSLHPLLIIPPIPDKHTLTDYAAKGVGVGLSKSRDDAELVKRRRRMLESFLRRCSKLEAVKNDPCFLRFLEGRMTWYEIQTSPPLIHLPKNLLRTSLSNPASPTRQLSYSSLPLPAGSELFTIPPTSSSISLSLSSNAALSQSTPQPKVPNQRFLDSEAFTNRFASHLKSGLEKNNRKLVKRWNESSADFGELGAVLNGFALWLNNDGGLANAVEMTGKAADAIFLASGELLSKWESQFTEPLHEYSQFSIILQRLLRFRHLKHCQLEMAEESLAAKRSQLAEFTRVEEEALRLDRALERGGRGLVRTSGSIGGSGTFERRNAETERNETADRNWHRKSLYGEAAEDGFNESGGNAWNNTMADSKATQNASTSRDEDDDWSKVNSSSNPTLNSEIPQASPSAPSQMPQSVTARTLNNSSSISTSSGRTHTPSSSYSGFLGAITHTFQSVMDTDPEATRRNNMGRLREQIVLLEEAVELTHQDLALATSAIQADLDRFQRQKVSDMRDMMLDLVKAHRDFCRDNLNSWEEAKSEISKIKPTTNSSSNQANGSGNENGSSSEMPSSRLGAPQR